MRLQLVTWGGVKSSSPRLRPRPSHSRRRKKALLQYSYSKKERATMLTLAASFSVRTGARHGVLRAPACRLMCDIVREDPTKRDTEGQDLSETFLLYEPPEDECMPLPPGAAPKPLGIGKARGEVHRDGDWHRSVHVWLVSSAERSLLLQQRSETKDVRACCCPSLVLSITSI